MEIKESSWPQQLSFASGGIIKDRLTRCDGYIWQGPLPKIIFPGDSVETTGGIGINTWVDSIISTRK